MNSFNFIVNCIFFIRVKVNYICFIINSIMNGFYIIINFVFFLIIEYFERYNLDVWSYFSCFYFIFFGSDGFCNVSFMIFFIFWVIIIIKKILILDIIYIVINIIINIIVGNFIVIFLDLVC